MRGSRAGSGYRRVRRAASPAFPRGLRLVGVSSFEFGSRPSLFAVRMLGATARIATENVADDGLGCADEFAYTTVPWVRGEARKRDEGSDLDLHAGGCTRTARAFQMPAALFVEPLSARG